LNIYVDLYNAKFYLAIYLDKTGKLCKTFFNGNLVSLITIVTSL